MDTKSNDVDVYIDRMLNNFVNKAHKDDAIEFLNVRRRYEKNNNRDLSSHTLRNDTQSLLALDRFLKDKKYIDANAEVLHDFEEHLKKTKMNVTKKTKLNVTTIEQYLIHIKRFYKYLYNKEDYKKSWQKRKNLKYPECVEWIMSSSNSKQIFKEDLPTEEEILKLLNVCDNTRDKALISAVLYDAGLRIGEIVSLNCNSAMPDKNGYKIKLPKADEYASGEQKTGRGIVRLFIMPSSIQFLRDFINQHPFYKYKDKFNVPLFYTLDSRYYYPVLTKANKGIATQEDFEKLRLTAQGIEGILTKYCGLAGIKKYTPHAFRHLSATRCGELGFNEPELRVRFRWSVKSKMPSRYVHPTDKAIDTKIKTILGIEEPDKADKSILVPIVCWNCQEENACTNVHCSKCGSNLKPSKEEMTVTAIDTGLTLQKMYAEIQKLREEIKKK